MPKYKTIRRKAFVAPVKTRQTRARQMRQIINQQTAAKTTATASRREVKS